MPDEVTIKMKSEPGPTATVVVPSSQTATLPITQLVNICAIALGVSFFLPWANIFGANLSGFDLQKMGDIHRLLWAIPAFSLLTFIAGVTKHSQKVIGQLTGLLPFLVGVYWYIKLRGDFFHVLTYGAYLSLIFGAALFILPRRSK